MRNIFNIIFIFLLISSYSYANDRPSNNHEVFFKGTDFELHVYNIKGRIDGKTMLIIGGIQGDEPGGFLSADLYSDIALEKGNLIVVPRANLKSVILFNRAPDGDMNRLFTDDKYSNIQGQVVDKLKELMSKSDILLNLHDGWGFHNPEYIDKNRNPNRFGQSIIIDEATYTCNNNTLDLKSMAERVLEKVNSKISDKKLHLHLFNTETGNEKSRFKDMRKTATWYALTKECIPAFGIEGSKNVKDIELNILYHNYAVNEFMEIMEIIPEQPKILTDIPKIESIIIKVNDETYNVKGNETLNIKKGDKVEVLNIESNYTRGITCDILGYGSLNDTGKEIVINGDTKVVFRKENNKITEITLKTIKNNKVSNSEFILYKINGDYKMATNGDTISINGNDTLELVTFIDENGKNLDIPINLKGYVKPNSVKNSGDDRGIKIVSINKHIMKRFSLNRDGITYPIIAGDENNPKAKVFLVLKNE